MRLWTWGAGLAGLVILGAGIWTWDPLPATPAARVLAQAASDYDVEIIRDSYGIPHIYGARDVDTAFGLAYAHAEDDFDTIQLAVAAARGDLARYRGKAAAPTDYIVALMGVWETIDARYESDVTPEVKAMAEAYAAGLNLYASENRDQTWAGLAPFTPQDIIAGFIFKTPFFYGLDETLLELFGDDHMQQIALDPEGKRKAWIAGPKRSERGSNAMAVAPRRSGDGVTRLVINSHQPLEGPVAWYEAHVTSGEGMEITGALFPGTPVVLMGFTPNIGWANTVSHQDLTDVFVLEVNPDNPSQYRLDGEWKDFEQSTATIRVRLAGPFALKVKRPVKRSVHGPVIESAHGVYAIRYAGMGEIRQLEQYYRYVKATSLEEFWAALQLNALPSINYIYADKAGNVGFFHNAQYPARNDAWDWSAEMPGDRSDLIWQGYRPANEMPRLINPVSGFVFNSNNRPFDATDGPDNLRPEDFPQSMGLQEDQTNRSLRIIELTDGETVIDREALLALKFDTGYAPGSEADTVVTAVLEADWSDQPEMAEALAHLAEWDLKMDASSRYAALGGLTVLPQITARFTGKPAPEPEEAFRQAVTYLMTHHGRIDPKWGEVNKLVRGSVNLPIDGGPDTLRAVYPADLGEDGQLHMSAGDTWIALVEWDENGRQSAQVISPYGASQDPASPHYADQASLFATKGWRTPSLSRESVEADAQRTYRPGH